MVRRSGQVWRLPNSEDMMYLLLNELPGGSWLILSLVQPTAPIVWSKTWLKDDVFLC